MLSARNHYLQAMGIQVWHLREPLAGGKAIVPKDSTTDKAFDEDALQPLATPVSAQRQDELSSSLQQSARVSGISPVISEATENSLDTQQAATLAATAVANKEESAGIESNPVFRMASIIYPGCCLIVTEVPVQGVEPIAEKQLVLLKNLLFSLGCNISEQPVITLFNWPMLRTAGFDQSSDAAHEACQAFLRGQKLKQTVSFVLLMGQQAGRYMLTERKSFEANKGQLIATPEQPTLLSYSIQQLFDQPQLKSELWHDVQPLRGWLQQA